MRKKNIIIIVIISLVLIFHEQIFIGSWLAAVDITGHIAIMKADIIEKKAREANREAAEKWVVSKYGEAVAKVVKLEYRKRVNGFGTDSIFRMDAPFATGTLFVESDKNHLVEGGFDLEGKKFQHLYSEWVKKQVGIDDENVELEFGEGLKDNRQIGGRPYVNFDLITNLSEDYREVFENTHNLYVKSVDINNFYSSEANEVIKVVKLYETLIMPYIFNEGDKRLWFGVNLKNEINDKKDPYHYSIVFDYNKNEKKYYKYFENRPVENNKSEYILF